MNQKELFILNVSVFACEWLCYSRKELEYNVSYNFPLKELENRVESYININQKCLYWTFLNDFQKNSQTLANTLKYKFF